MCTICYTRRNKLMHLQVERSTCALWAALWAAMAAPDRAAKLRRLNDFRRGLPHISQSGLAAVLDEVERHGAPELHSRQAMQAATAAELSNSTPYGDLLVDLPVVSAKHTAMTLLAMNPIALVCLAYEQGGSFTQLFDAAWAQAPSTPDQPWRLILYGDEVVPGNAIGFDNLRKCWVLYFSFFEFGMLALQHEEAWFTLLVSRSSVVAKVSGGISQVYGAAIKLFFGQCSGVDLKTGGMVLRRPNGEQLRLFADLWMILQDGGAHKMVWHCKADRANNIFEHISRKNKQNLKYIYKTLEHGSHIKQAEEKSKSSCI